MQQSPWYSCGTAMVQQRDCIPMRQRYCNRPRTRSDRRDDRCGLDTPVVVGQLEWCRKSVLATVGWSQTHQSQVNIRKIHVDNAVDLTDLTPKQRSLAIFPQGRTRVIKRLPCSPRPHGVIFPHRPLG